jgi:hypothetical protein
LLNILKNKPEEKGNTYITFFNFDILDKKYFNSFNPYINDNGLFEIKLDKKIKFSKEETQLLNKYNILWLRK